jgi:hypothetical protein
MQAAAREIAERALVRSQTHESVAESLSEAIVALHAHGDEARRTRNGRELTLFETHPEKIGRLIDHLLAGNYRDTAGTLAGITARSVRGWMEAAERGDSRYEPIAQVIKIAEAHAEAPSVRNVRAAGNDPRFWAADMTYLERKYPDRWARRNEAADTPKVVVINAKDSPVQVNVAAEYALSPSSPGETVDGPTRV